MTIEDRLRVVCSECKAEVAFGRLGRCPTCQGILQAEYDDAAIGSLKDVRPGRGIGRYWKTLPLRTAPESLLAEGDTPLIASRRIGASLGLKSLWFKHEGMNPTGAFKDRAGAMAAALAREAGAKGILSASSGNASSAMAAYCAAAGLACVILMEPGNPLAKLRQTLAMGARVVMVEGIFGHGPEALADFLMKAADGAGYYLGFVWGPVNPYILEGIKTISYEIMAALPGAATPGAVVAPVGGGDMFAAQWRGWRELERAGLVEHLPRMIGVQSLSAPPLLQAFEQGAGRVTTLPYANSKISGINVPFTGDHALRAVRESGGAVMGVSDGEVLAMQQRMAVEEGVWVEPAGAAPLAALPRLLEQGLIQADEPVVCILSGAGFKDTSLAADQVELISRQKTVALDAKTVIEEIRL